MVPNSTVVSLAEPRRRGGGRCAGSASCDAWQQFWDGLLSLLWPRGHEKGGLGQAQPGKVLMAHCRNRCGSRRREVGVYSHCFIFNR